MYEDLRKASAMFTDRHFPAVSIGGSYTSKEVLYKTLEWCVPYFQEDKPRHLLGIGEVQDLFEGVARGIDFFDCVAPTRRGRHGTFYISPENGGSAKQNFTLNIFNAKYQLDSDPIDPGCLCMVCQTYTRSYIRHLFVADELLAQRLGSYHNVYFIVNLVKRIREAILDGSFSQMKEQWLAISR
jgi:queuine tRNA-ribosyltransferase/7-cyano-7-deazaguanine tRNA-ribosyltransferase